MEDEQMSISGYVQIKIFTYIGVNFADSEIIVNTLKLIHQHFNYGDSK